MSFRFCLLVHLKKWNKHYHLSNNSSQSTSYVARSDLYTHAFTYCTMSLFYVGNCVNKWTLTFSFLSMYDLKQELYTLFFLVLDNCRQYEVPLDWLCILVLLDLLIVLQTYWSTNVWFEYNLNLIVRSKSNWTLFITIFVLLILVFFFFWQNQPFQSLKNPKSLCYLHFVQVL